MTSFGVLPDVSFTRLNLLWWLHWEITSDLLFSNFLSGTSITANFSFKKRLHFFKVGLLVLYCPLIFHVSLGACCFCFKLQYSVDKVVSFSNLIKLNDFCGLHNASWMSFHRFLYTFFVPIYFRCILQ